MAGAVWVIEDTSLDLNADNGSTAFLTFLRANITVYDATGDIVPTNLDREGSPFSLWYVR